MKKNRDARREIPVFVGSTYEDLKDYREAVRAVLHRLEVPVKGMEYFGSKPGRPKDECLKAVHLCKVYIGIFAMRYGSIDEETEKSMTHLEYEEAQELQLPSLIYLMDEEKQPLLPKYIEIGGQAKKLVGLKTMLKKRHMISKFTTPDDLARQISQDLPPILEDIQEGTIPTSGRDFLEVADFTTNEIHKVFQLALEMKVDPMRHQNALKGQSIALIFEKQSLRTHTSFQVAIHQLGGNAVFLTQADISLGKRESIYDTAKSLDCMVQGIILRTYNHQIAQEMARYARIPVINAISDYAFPCQALSDFLTLREIKGKLEGLKLSYVGDGNMVTNSLMVAGARLGTHVTVICPKGFEPQEIAVITARKAARKTRSCIEIVIDPTKGMKDADAVYTDIWPMMGEESENETLKRVFQIYQVNEDLMAKAKPDAIFMHCLPAHRGVEVTNSVIDAPYSAVHRQMENRIPVLKAIIFMLLGRESRVI